MESLQELSHKIVLDPSQGLKRLCNRKEPGLLIHSLNLSTEVLHNWILGISAFQKVNSMQGFKPNLNSELQQSSYLVPRKVLPILRD